MERADGLMARRLGGSRQQRQLALGWANLMIAVMLADVARAVNRDELSVRLATRRADDVAGFIAGASERQHELTPAPTPPLRRGVVSEHATRSPTLARPAPSGGRTGRGNGGLR